MKTKLVLMAMALPALFAACTSDEFVEPAQGNLNGRALLDGLTVDVDQSASTRFAWGDYKWKFETGDQFGAAVTDPTKFGEVVDDHLLGNYIFSKAADGSYGTTSQMYEGTYLFYSYPDFQGKATRDLIEFELGIQKADLAKPEKVISNTQLFFSPLYQVEAKTVATALPLKFYPYWSVAAFKIKNNTGAAFKISQIVLTGEQFYTKGKINPKAIKEAKLIYSIAEGDSKYSLPEGMTEEKYAEEMAAANIVKSGATPVNSITLSCDNYELADGKEVVAYMSVPASATDTKVKGVDIIVNVEGESRSIKVVEKVTDPDDKATIASTGISGLKFLRGQTKPVFGFETGGKNMKALVVAKTNLQDAAGFYVDNKDNLLSVLNEQRGNISIYNTGDLAIDKDVAEALTLNSGAGVTFKNPINVAVDGDATISKTTFDGGVTVKSGNVTFEGVTLSEGSSTTAKNTMVVAGGKVVLKSGTYEKEKSSIVVNGGELVVAGTNENVNEIVMNNGTLTMKGQSQIIGSKSDGDTPVNGIEKLTFNDDDKKKTKLNVSLSDPDGGEVTLYIGADVILEENTTTTVDAKNKVDIESAKKLTNKGELVNNGTISENGTFENEGSISNASLIKKVNNSGFITNTSEWDSSVTEAVTSGSGYIDNTVGAAVKVATTSKASTVYRVFEGADPEVPNKKELMVFKDVTFTKPLGYDNKTNNGDSYEESKNESLIRNVLFLGKTEIKTAVDFAGATVQIGLNIGVSGSGDAVSVTKDSEYQELAEKILGKSLSKKEDVKNINAYKASVATYVYEDATFSGATLNNYGAVSRSKGTVTFNPDNTTSWN